MAPTGVLKEWLAIGTYLAAIVAAMASWFQYHRNSRRERTRWLFDLYQRFYENPGLKNMRVRIDWGDTAFVSEEKDQQLMQELDDYLNFFEFIAYLLKRGELRRDEVLAMFDYPLHRIAADNSVSQHVGRPEYGYEGLRDLLKQFG